MSTWIDKIIPSIIKSDSKKNSVPEGLWRKCAKCEAILYKPELERNLHVCPKCEHHMRINARTRLDTLLDIDGRVEIGEKVAPVDHLKFKDTKKYKDRISAAQKNTNEKDALVVMKGTIHDFPLVVAVFEFSFMGGSMGSVVGEKFIRAVNICLENKIPLVCFSASGGARMQEALISLMQMAKTSAGLAKLAEQGIPYISVLTDPVYGGVSASLAMLGDVNIAEPNAMIGFSGPRVIEQTVKEKLPEGFQRSEFLLDHGALDMIVHRKDMQATLVRILGRFIHHIKQRENAVDGGVGLSLDSAAADLGTEMNADSVSSSEMSESGDNIEKARDRDVKASIMDNSDTKSDK